MKTALRPLAVALGLVLLAPAAPAAELTTVIDTFERDPDKKLVDFSLEIGWEMLQRSGKIRREFRCLAHDEAVEGLCPDGSRVIDVNELTTERTIHALNIDAELGFGRLAQLHLKLPVILSDETKLAFDDGVDRFNSSVDPDNEPSLFSLPFDGTSRSGLGDLVFGVRFTPLSWSRDQTRPTWAIGLDLTFPTAAVKEADNDAVGEGLWRIELSSAMAARFKPWIEPYFRVSGTFNLATGGSLFQEYGRTQTLEAPGHNLSVALGTEFIPYEDHAKRAKVSIDIGGSIDYQFEGREYSDLFEALGTSPCDPRDQDNPCDLTTFTRGDIDLETNRRRKTDGITDIEQYATFTGWVGVNYQAMEHLKIRLQVSFAHETDHFITTADAGKDLDGANQVEEENSFGENEFNPVYNSAYDALGTRFRTGNTSLLGVQISLMGKF